MRPLACFVLVFVLLSLISACLAQQSATSAVPNLITYSSTLNDASGGATLSSRTVGVTFAIYRQQDGGAPIWLETQNVTTDASGHYSVLLGSTRAEGIPSDLFSALEERWLGVKAEGQPEQARVMLVSVPYAFKAHEAETLGGLPPSAFVKAPPSDASVGLPDVGTATSAVAAAASGKTTKALPPSTPGYIPIWLSGTSFINSTMYQTSAGNVGVGTTTPAAKLDVNGGINAATVYKIAGVTVLSNSPGTPFNLFVGVGAGTSNTSGLDNTFIGTSAGQNVTAANFNTISGAGAGYGNTSGSSNTIYGYAAGYSYSLSLTGSGNTFVGATSGHEDTSGFGNTFIGNAAAYNNTTGSNNTALGSMSGPSSPALTNATAIGANAVVSESNALVLGGTGANAVNVGIGTTTPTATLDVKGTTSVAGVVQSTSGGFKFPDGTVQTTAELQGPQGPQGVTGSQGLQGPQGPPGPPVHTSAACTQSAPRPGCNQGTVTSAPAPCTVTSDTGSCSALPGTGGCAVCYP